MSGLLWAALEARSVESVEAAVGALAAWVRANAQARRMCFISGLSAALISELATHFPFACTALLSIAPQASRDLKASGGSHGERGCCAGRDLEVGGAWGVLRVERYVVMAGQGRRREAGEKQRMCSADIKGAQPFDWVDCRCPAHCWGARPRCTSAAAHATGGFAGCRDAEGLPEFKVKPARLGSTHALFLLPQLPCSFHWRSAELQELEQRGYSLEQIELLVDYNMRWVG